MGGRHNRDVSGFKGSRFKRDQDQAINLKGCQSASNSFQVSASKSFQFVRLI
jgi:hypothetical protein